MNIKPYTHPNDAKGPTYVQTVTGTRLVHAGETVMVPDTGGQKLVDERVLGAASTDDLSKLLTLPIKQITPQLAALDIDSLGQLFKLEDQGQKRSTLLTAIEDAGITKQLDQPVDLLLPVVNTSGAVDLARLARLERARPEPRGELIAAIEERELKLKAGEQA